MTGAIAAIAEKMNRRRMMKTDNPEHAKFGNGIGVGFQEGYSRWFRGEPNIVRTQVVPVMERWMCPIENCTGEMKSTGGAWPVHPMGYHHKCDQCGFTAALSGVEYPKISYSFPAL